MSFDLDAEVLEFSNEIQDLLDGVLPLLEGSDPLLRQVTVTEFRDSLAVEMGTGSTGSAQAVPLLTGGRKTADLFVSFRLQADHARRYLAVSQSIIELRVRRHPVLRLDFNRSMYRAPGCHWNVHAERGHASALLIRNDPEHSGELSDVHLPVGGARMRPCLEDVLQMLVQDFGFDALPEAQRVIDDGRERWRRRQLGALVRDVPDVAVRVLRELGYTVTEPASGPREINTMHLRAW